MITIWNKLMITTVYGVVVDIKREVRGNLLKDIKDIGTDLMVTCPFHKGGQERKASMGISKGEVVRDGHTLEAGTCHCYTCGWTGDLPKFIQEILGLQSKKDGFEWLVSRYYYND